jgi:hypothetical protein
VPAAAHPRQQLEQPDLVHSQPPASKEPRQEAGQGISLFDDPDSLILDQTSISGVYLCKPSLPSGSSKTAKRDYDGCSVTFSLV